MKRAPVIPKHTIKTQPLEDTPSSAPAAPMVDSLIAREELWLVAMLLLCLYVVGT